MLGMKDADLKSVILQRVADAAAFRQQFSLEEGTRLKDRVVYFYSDKYPTTVQVAIDNGRARSKALVVGDGRVARASAINLGSEGIRPLGSGHGDIPKDSELMKYFRDVAKPTAEQRKASEMLRLITEDRACFREFVKQRILIQDDPETAPRFASEPEFQKARADTLRDVNLSVASGSEDQTLKVDELDRAFNSALGLEQRGDMEAASTVYQALLDDDRSLRRRWAPEAVVRYAKIVMVQKDGTCTALRELKKQARVTWEVKQENEDARRVGTRTTWKPADLTAMYDLRDALWDSPVGKACIDVVRP
jgi:hypothetical protein